MAETRELARPYAVAAFKQAEEEGGLGEWAEMLELLAAIARDPAMSGLITNPRVGRARLVELFIDVCGDRLSDTGRNFVKVVGQYGRFALLPDIALRFAEERAAREGRNQIQVASAFKLSKPQRTTIVPGDGEAPRHQGDARLRGGRLADRRRRHPRRRPRHRRVAAGSARTARPDAGVAHELERASVAAALETHRASR